MSEVLRPLSRFHKNHGANVILYENETVAYRKASFANALTIGERPLLPGEIFLVEIQKTEPGWTGHMRFGLTQINPASLEFHKLPFYSLPDMNNLGNSWICAITKSHNRIPDDTDMPEHEYSHEVDSPNIPDKLINDIGEEDFDILSGLSMGSPRLGGCRMADDLQNLRRVGRMRQKKSIGLDSLITGEYIRTARGLLPLSELRPEPIVIDTPNGKQLIPHDNILPTDKGSRIGIIYLPRGDFAEMHYIINGEDQGAFTKNLPYKRGNLYPVVDVYGTTKQVKIIQFFGVSVPSLQSACRTTILQNIMKHSVNSLPLPMILKDYLMFKT